MNRARAVVLAVAIAAASLVPAAAGGARPHLTFFSDCVAQETLIPMTREQAQSYLPEGFSPTVGAADQSEQVYFKFLTLNCGDPQQPELQLVAALMHVDAPDRYASAEGGDQFVFDIVGAGPRLRELTKATCIGDLLEKGEISTSFRVDREELGAALATTTVESPLISGTFDAYAAGTDFTGGASARWLYERNGKIRYVDSAHSVNFLSFGAGDAVFTSPYRDMTPVAAAGSIVQERDELMFVTPSGC